MRREEVVFFCGLVAGCGVDQAKLEHLDPPKPTRRAAWTSSALSVPRNGYWDSFVQLASGRVLVVGGSTSLEFDLTTGTFTPTSALGETLTRPALALLPSGKVLAAGSITSASGDYHEMSVARLYDPTTRTWTAAAPLPRPVDLPSATTTNDGRAALIGGQDATVGDAVGVDLYNPSTNSWTKGPNLPTAALFYPKAVSVGTKTLFLDTNGRAAVFDPSSIAWTAAPDGAAYAALAPIGGGKALAVAYGVAKAYDVATNAWTAVAPPPVNAYGAAAVALSTGKLLLVGGRDGASSAVITANHQYDPGVDKWFPSGDVAAPHYDQHRVFVVGDRAAVVGNNASWTLAETFALTSLGGACAAGYECKSAGCVDSVCCSTASCPTDSTCAAAGSAGTCKKKLAAACSSGSQCASGNCVDGVCCASSCSGQCEACDVAGSAGTCTAVIGAPHGGRAACAGAGVGTSCGPTCNGSDRTKCAFPTGATACGTASCAAGVETHVSTCTGAGACGDVPKACGVYACGTSTCKTTCSGAGDCIAGYYCKAGTCVATEGLGKDCTKAADCGTGFCVDGVCCATSGCPTDSACNANPSAKGTCSKVAGSACAVDAQCGSGHCVDSVCCATTCDGQCEACDVPTHLGVCWPVVGAPHGARPTCPSSTSACGQSTCDGAKDTKSCVGLTVDVTRVCGAAKCVDGRFTPSTTCDESGKCPVLAATSCVPYGCTEAGCRTACAGDPDCAKGYVCSAGKCAPPVAHCSEDGRSAIDEAGGTTRCTPYLCKKGYCARSCTDSTECTDGTACNVALGSCEAIATPSVVEDSGGCSHQRASPSGWLVVVLLGGLLRKRSVS